MDSSYHWVSSHYQTVHLFMISFSIFLLFQTSELHPIFFKLFELFKKAFIRVYTASSILNKFKCLYNHITYISSYILIRNFKTLHDVHDNTGSWSRSTHSAVYEDDVSVLWFSVELVYWLIYGESCSISFRILLAYWSPSITFRKS